MWVFKKKNITTFPENISADNHTKHIFHGLLWPGVFKKSHFQLGFKMCQELHVSNQLLLKLPALRGFFPSSDGLKGLKLDTQQSSPKRRLFKTCVLSFSEGSKVAGSMCLPPAKRSIRLLGYRKEISSCVTKTLVAAGSVASCSPAQQRTKLKHKRTLGRSNRWQARRKRRFRGVSRY